jgi:long-chain-acyl-CoA dehydrogenase
VTSDFYGDDLEMFRATVAEFAQREVVPNLERWDEQKLVDRDVWLAAGKQGLLCTDVPEEYGGGGQDDYRYRCVIMEEMANVNANAVHACFGLNDDIVVSYLLDLGTEEQKQRWLPRMAAGELITAIAMTEPGAGSDLQGVRTTALRDGDEYVVNGSKTFITNGIASDIVIVVARTDPAAGSRGISLLVVEEGMPGFTRGRKLEKIGLWAQDTAELFFDDVRVPAANLLGREGGGFGHLMERLPRERLAIAYYALASAEAIFIGTLRYVRERKAFGQAIADFQNTRFVLAEMSTELEVTRAFLERCVLQLNAGTLSTVSASKAKWWATDMQTRVIDRCLQLHGGYGYMLEYPVARAFIDSRIQTIYGGTNEIMKEIIGRELVR